MQILIEFVWGRAGESAPDKFPGDAAAAGPGTALCIEGPLETLEALEGIWYWRWGGGLESSGQFSRECC